MSDKKINASLGNFTMGSKQTPQSYLTGALYYQRAAEILANHLPDLLPVFKQLVGQSLECTLKAYVMHNGQSPKTRGKNHDLKYWWDNCNSLDLDIGEFPEWAKKINARYNRPFLTRYFQSNTGFVGSPKEIVLQGLAEVIKKVSDEIQWPISQ